MNPNLYQYRSAATAVAMDFSPVPGSKLAYLLLNTTDGIIDENDTVRVEVNGNVIGGGTVADIPIIALCTRTDSVTGGTAANAVGPWKWTPPLPIQMASDKALRVTITGTTGTCVAVFLP